MKRSAAQVDVVGDVELRQAMRKLCLLGILPRSKPAPYMVHEAEIRRNLCTDA